MAALNTLPNEILSLITRHLDHPKDVLNLSLVCRRLGNFAKLDGWKALLKGRFGFGGLDSDARVAVHGLTTLYRNWNRKGFIAAYLEPTQNTTSLNTWRPERWRPPQGQTMGYQPSIDSYEEMYGGWGERREVLAWSAGTQIILRTKETGANVEKIRQREQDLEEARDQTWAYDSFKHLNTWFTYRIPDSFEGRDDITRLKLFRPHQRNLACEDMVFGTASGELSLLSVNPGIGETLVQQYETGRRGVNGLSVSSSSVPMVAAALADSSLALYAVDRDHTSHEKIKPASEVKTTSAGTDFGGLWSCEFLSHDKIAVARKAHIEPIEVYHIGPGGLMPVPLRSFSIVTDNAATSRPMSVYSILPTPSTPRWLRRRQHIPLRRLRWPHPPARPALPPRFRADIQRSNRYLPNLLARRPGHTTHRSRRSRPQPNQSLRPPPLRLPHLHHHPLIHPSKKAIQAPGLPHRQRHQSLRKDNIRRMEFIPPPS